jgi:hypothetical protein
MLDRIGRLLALGSPSQVIPYGVGNTTPVWRGERSQGASARRLQCPVEPALRDERCSAGIPVDGHDAHLWWWSAPRYAQLCGV